MEPHPEETKRLVPILLAFSLAVVGGFVKEIASPKEHSFWRFVVGAVIGGFTGVIAYCLCMHWNFEWWLSAAISGMAGYLGSPLLDAMGRMVKGKILNS